jgi:hypothetical protein
MRNVRQVTCQVLELVEMGLLDPVKVMEAALSYMSEDDVADMARANDWTYMIREMNGEDEGDE